MDLTHHFTVPVGVEQTWAHFNEIASVAACFPGAQVTSAEGDSFAGSVKVKLGPIALVYNGAGTFVEKDHNLHRFVADAKGNDKRGNGTAGAKVTLTMAENAEGGTDVEVVTNLAITGKPAQFGRGVLQDVSDKLLGQFVSCLEERLSAEGDAAAEPAAGPPPETPGAPAVALPPVPPVYPEQAITSNAAAAEVTNGVPAAEPPPHPVRAAVAPPSAEPSAARFTAAPPRKNDSLDLGAAVLPVLVKAYWKPALVALAVIVVLLVILI